MFITNKINFKTLCSLFFMFILAACAHTDFSKPIILDSDLAFEFGSDKLTEAGKKQIDMYVPSLTNRREARLEVVGHSDRIGNAKANQRLSERRAQAVANQLLSSGKIDPDHVRIRGLGDRDPVVQCNQSARQALIDCLAPNRRVEIRVNDIFY